MAASGTSIVGGIAELASAAAVSSRNSRFLAGGGGAVVDDGVAPEMRALEAAGWGLLSALSLVLGSGIGIAKLPSKVVRATLMAFGGGALIEALSIELFAHIIATAKGGHGEGGDKSIVFMALGAALAGGLFFAGLDRLISSQGAFMRKAATLHAYVGRLRYALLRRLVSRLRLVPMFEALSEQELQKLAGRMVKERYPAGAVIFRDLCKNSSIFFLLSGRVRLTIRHRDAGEDAGQIGSSDPSLENGVADVVEDHFRLGPNDIFGETSLFSGETVEAEAVAATKVTVLRISSVTLHQQIASNKRLQDFIAMTAIDRLRETDVFRRCTPSTVARLVTFMRQAEYEAGDVLYHDVDSLCPIYFVVLGSVQVATTEHLPVPGLIGGIPQEDTSPLHYDITGDMSSAKGMAPGRVTPPVTSRRIVGANGLLGTEHLVHGRAVHATASALERTTVLIVQRQDIEKLCERDQRFRHSIVSESISKALGADELQDELKPPPEGVVAPYTLGTLKDLGWRRQDENDDAEDFDVHLGTLDCKTTPIVQEEIVRETSENDHLSVGEEDLPELLENADAAAAEVAGKAGAGGHHGHDGRDAQAALMIWVGILIDGVPESVVMGILANTASKGTLLAFVVGVFLANFPEAMSSAGTMKLHGVRTPVIMLMWASITLLTGIGAGVGALMFPPGSTSDPSIQKAIACIEGLCGGAMLCMIANTVLPEAFEQGGNVTGMATLCGFLVAIAVSVSGS
eukprot:TRINITY_DN29238_c0_g1_i1.p1 TRINITY_DN29238_c0_g1~~TRINITY_DN29238_c0_g1_i1.p1  ORF type:complete len:763 (+),score=158.22 TRINITY_DN29238_c0_g1_i1:66-2291(+)